MGPHNCSINMKVERNQKRNDRYHKKTRVADSGNPRKID